MSVKPTQSSITRVAHVLMQLLLLFVLIGFLLLLVPELRQSISTRVNYSFNYSKLIRQPAPTPNSLPNPIIDAHLTDTWGAARSGGRKHEGIDIFAKRHTPIHSTTNGVVKKVGVDRLGGNVVIIIGSGGLGHYYAHLDAFAPIKKGDWVNTGDVIGYVGNSGNAKNTPPHVHYGIYTATGAINPYPLLKK